MPAPQLSLSTDNQAKADLILSIELKIQIMDFLAEGHSWLEAAQRFNLSEKEVGSYLDEAYNVRTKLLRTSAEHLMTFIFQEHQEMYFRAKRCAYPEPVEREGKLIEQPVDIMWFREARAQLNEMKEILKRYLGTTEDKKENFVFTFLPGSQFEKFVQSLQSYDGMTIYDRS